MGASKKDWPLGQGYDRFYGFIGGETNNWYPDLAEDNHYIDQPYLPEDGYHLSKDLADQALRLIRDSKQTEPDKPWYLWFCPGANHAPHHAPQEYIDKYKGKFDDGYEAYREWVLPRMIERGILPEGTELTADQPDARGHVHRRPTRAAVGRRSPTRRRRLFCRMAEVYAGFSEYTDAQVGRIVDYLEESGQLDNTIIFYCADNGASGEGSPNGSVNEGKFFNGYPDDDRGEPADGRPARQPRHLQPLPDRLGDGVLDAVPDVQALHVPGRRLRPAGDPLAGRASRRAARCATSTTTAPTSSRRSSRPAASRCPTSSTASSRRRCPASRCATPSTTPTRRPQKETQYYEMLGTRGIWHEGWKAVTEHGPIGGMGKFDEDTLAALPHRRGPRRGARPRRASTRRRSRSSRRSGSRRRRRTTCCR